MSEQDQDKELICCDCLSAFTWSDGEQRFFREHGWDPPKRCKPCRAYIKRKTLERDREVQEQMRRREAQHDQPR